MLKKFSFEPNEIINILNKASGVRYSQLIDFDIDVDKIDYLARDAHHTGLIYGKTDVDRLINSLFFDDEHRLCVRYKGRQALENFLLARYYMFTTLYYHKTVYALELMIKNIYNNLRRLRNKQTRIPKPIELVENIDKFSKFDDTFFWHQLYNYRGSSNFYKKLINMIISREPLKLVCEESRLLRESINERYYRLMLLYSKEQQRELLSRNSSIPRNWIFVERLNPIQLTSRSEEDSIRIEPEEKSKVTIPVRNDPSSIISVLGTIERECIRVYTHEKYKNSLDNYIQDMYLT
jgi:HD superfamily phosphohydrolase